MINDVLIALTETANPEPTGEPGDTVSQRNLIVGVIFAGCVAVLTPDTVFGLGSTVCSLAGLLGATLAILASLTSKANIPLGVAAVAGLAVCWLQWPHTTHTFATGPAAWAAATLMVGAAVTALRGQGR